MIVFGQEKLAPIWPQIIGLGHAHWQETEDYRHGQQFNPDAARYFAFNEIESHGGAFYTMFTARDEGRLVGYAGMYVTSSMHTQQIISTEDTYFLLPEYRKGRNALEFYKFVEDEMRKRRVVEIGMTTKLQGDEGGKIMALLMRGVARLLGYLGYKLVSLQFSKHLEYNQAIATAGDAPRSGVPPQGSNGNVQESCDVRTKSTACT